MRPARNGWATLHDSFAGASSAPRVAAHADQHAQPAYRPDREPGRSRRRRPKLRLWLPLIGAAVCLVVAGFVPPLPGHVLVMAAFGLFLDAATSLWPKGDGLTKYRQ